MKVVMKDKVEKHGIEWWNKAKNVYFIFLELRRNEKRLKFDIDKKLDSWQKIELTLIKPSIVFVVLKFCCAHACFDKDISCKSLSLWKSKCLAFFCRWSKLR